MIISIKNVSYILLEFAFKTHLSLWPNYVNIEKTKILYMKYYYLRD